VPVSVAILAKRRDAAPAHLLRNPEGGFQEARWLRYSSLEYLEDTPRSSRLAILPPENRAPLPNSKTHPRDSRAEMAVDLYRNAIYLIFNPLSSC